MRFFYISQSCIHIFSKVFLSTSKQLTQDVSWIRFGQEFNKLIEHMKSQTDILERLKSSLRKFYGRYGILFDNMKSPFHEY